MYFAALFQKHKASTMKSTRRIILIFLSVTTGSLISLWIMKKRMGTLSPNDYMQIGLNFLFAAALVVGVSIFLQKMNNKDRKDLEKRQRENKGEN